MTSSSPLPTVSLRGLDLPMTRVVLGTMSFGDTADAAVAEEIFETAIEAGITSIDCANTYARGTTEELIAPLVARHRDEITIATKAGMPHSDAGDHPLLSAVGLRSAVEGSLRRLGVDRIDLFYLHQPDRTVSLSETLGTVAELQAEGKIGALGVSNYAAWQVADIEVAAAAAGASLPIVGQNVYNLLARRIEDEWVEFAATHGILTMTYNPLAGGLLVQVPDRGTGPARFEAGSSLAEMYRKRYWSPGMLDAVTRLGGLAVEAGLALPELAIRWVMSRPGTGAILLGGDQVAHLRANLDAVLAGPLPTDLVEACDRISDELKGAMPAYNR